MTKHKNQQEQHENIFRSLLTKHWKGGKDTKDVLKEFKQMLPKSYKYDRELWRKIWEE